MVRSSSSAPSSREKSPPRVRRDKVVVRAVLTRPTATARGPLSAGNIETDSRPSPSITPRLLTCAVAPRRPRSRRVTRGPIPRTEVSGKSGSGSSADSSARVRSRSHPGSAGRRRYAVWRSGARVLGGRREAPITNRVRPPRSWFLFQAMVIRLKARMRSAVPQVCRGSVISRRCSPSKTAGEWLIRRVGGCQMASPVSPHSTGGTTSAMTCRRSPWRAAPGSHR